MKSSLVISVLIALLVIATVIYFNLDHGHENIPLKNLFKEDYNQNHNIVYEIVTNAQVIAPSTSSSSSTIVKPSPVVSSKEKQKNVATNPAANSAIGFSIQLASYKDKNQAKIALEKLKKNNAQGYLLTRDLKEKGVWYRVCLGRFSKKSDAENLLGEYKKDFPSSFIFSYKE